MQSQFTPCTIEGCERPIVARGWCSKHYYAWSKHGSPLYSPPDAAQRFWGRVNKTPDGCWLFTGYIAPNGYGRFQWPDAPRGGSAHVFALEQALGRPLAPGMMALHTCDVRVCVRNDDEGFYEINGILRHRRGHLWEGTTAENTADRHAKGRDAAINGALLYPERLSRGEDRHNAKLTEADVLLIRQQFAEGVRMKDLAETFGVNASNVRFIVMRQTWKHV